MSKKELEIVSELNGRSHPVEMLEMGYGLIADGMIQGQNKVSRSRTESKGQHR
jgi:hypothetical protein